MLGEKLGRKSVFLKFRKRLKVIPLVCMLTAMLLMWGVSMNNVTRNSFLDVLKGILIVFVIILHCSLENSKSTIYQYIYAYIIAFAVPMFLFVSGYVSALSFARKGISLEKAYEAKNLFPRLIRFIVPFSLFYICEWFIFRLNGIYQVNIIEYGVLEFFKKWFSGGVGMGSYYFPMMLQFVFMFPVVFFFIKKYEYKGLIGCFIVNALYEFMKASYGMNEGEYRLLIFRYIYIIAAGCYLALNYEKKAKIRIEVIKLLTGIGFVYLFNFTGYSPKIITYWSTTSFLTCLYICPIMNLLVKKVHFGFKPIEYIGRFSFDIFLVQMIYYAVYADRIYSISDNAVCRLLSSVVICVSAGALFYFAEHHLTEKIVSLIEKS